MANTTKTKAATKKTQESVTVNAVTLSADNIDNISVTPGVVTNNIVSNSESATEETCIVPVVTRIELPSDLYVPCVSMIRNGRLVYESKRQMGYSVVWENFMDVQYIELKELMAMKSSEVAFFKQNWIAIDDSFEYKDAVMEKLRIKEMYKDVPDPADFDRMFVLPIEEMVRRVGNMSKAMKETIASYAKECINSGSLDSMKRIKALENALGKSLS